ncbi:MAG: hypothetical protein GY773_00130 [Actinomycetia bacterium]|nr:hypothetical protein [Actinomycetes bacterium]
MARQFGATWWGRAWVDALENRASLDPNRLPRGRTYARHGHVAAVECEPGSIRALVSGSRRNPYRVEIRFRTFDDDEWGRLLAAFVARAERTAALLDGELHPDLVEVAADAGIGLLPHAGELRPRCSCPDWADPCKHSAAVCYLVADELDQDPFALLLLRGRDREQVLAGVRRLRSGRSGRSGEDGDTAGSGTGTATRRRPNGSERGVRAVDAWRRPLGSLPAVPTPRLHPGRPPVIGVEAPAGAPFTTDGITALAVDAAERAWATLTGDPALHLDLRASDDLARRAASLLADAEPNPAAADQFRLLADQAGVPPRALARRAFAWRVAGSAGLAAHDEPAWSPEPLLMAAARQALVESGVEAASVRVDKNRLTVGPDQFRFSRRRTWWRFVKRGGAWELVAGPAPDPDELIDIDP